MLRKNYNKHNRPTLAIYFITTSVDEQIYKKKIQDINTARSSRSWHGLTYFKFFRTYSTWSYSRAEQLIKNDAIKTDFSKTDI